MNQEQITGSLNPQQLEAVTAGDGPLLILAGAGSGKTRVVTSRIAWLIAEKQVKPWNICAITFTNKAAEEMRERVNRMVGFGAEAINVATFHSTCVRILRRFIDRIGYDNHFVIYDSDDSKSLMREICRDQNVNTKVFKERMILSRISAAKDELIYPADYAAWAGNDQEAVTIAGVYAEYQRRLKNSNALDFDDLIGLTVRLFQADPEVLLYYQERFRYLLVDEYQDTNKAQFVFVSLIAQKYRNLCVVGDDDQSIYRFRGADIGNILNFEKIFTDAKVIRLEQNYRSTQTILDAANAVIANNQGRMRKTLWTQNGQGGKVTMKRFDTAQQEAYYIVDDIARLKRKGSFNYGQCAILYRTNAQSRALEEQLLMENVPYSIIGGVNFYARKEIKDILAYLRTMANGTDDLSVRRIINTPKRGIGETTVLRVADYAASCGTSFLEAASHAAVVPGLGRSASKITEFVHLIEKLRSQSAGKNVAEILKMVVKETGYVEELEAERTDEALDRIANIDELISKAAQFDQAAGPEADGAMETNPAEDAGMETGAGGQVRTGLPALQDFLEQVALVADIDSLADDSDRVVLMTLHAAKGLEFDNVYLAGMDDGLFPSYHSISSGEKEDLEEERRLCYVGITRAKKRLTLTSAKSRMLRGQTEWYRVSRFIDEIPGELLDDNRNRQTAGGQNEIGGNDSYHMLSKAQAERKREHEEFRAKPFYMRGSSQHTGSSKGTDRFAGNGLRTAGSSATGQGSVTFGKVDLSALKGSNLQKTADLDYQEGDRVRHIKFGEGTVRKITDGARDKEVTVEFDRFGVKKMLAGFAILKKL
jgi:DNA helicase-2/ATP-dependent DNA helicase PcrA